MINIPKGTKDVLPQDSYKWQYIEKTARKIANLFNVREIRTPAFEYTELFLRSIGDETDVVSKEMYTFLDKGNRSITLKPEGTAPVARSFVENSLVSESLPLKMYYLSPVFRYERPQAGRLREHHQFGVEMYGSPSALMDAEVINLAWHYLAELGIRGVSLELNSIGCSKCRPNYNEALKGFLESNKDSLCPQCVERSVKNPLRTLDCKVDSCKVILQNAPKINEYICDDCSKHQSKLIEVLTALKIDFKVNTSIVRGLDYYTKTVFEFVTNELGAQGTICGGGRYDNMVESVGGSSVPCVGFGIGLERLILLMDKMNLPFKDKNMVEIFISPQSENQILDCAKIVNDLRNNGISAETDFLQRSVKSQFKYADKISAKNIAVIGESEILSGEVNIKDMSNGTVNKINTKDIVNYFRRGK